ncbi:MAG: hypothetical protein AB8B55_11955 [Mariniblastus sp.]
MPVKLDVSSPEYRQWSADHKSEGNSIPKLFVVRADGETLYGKSGSLSGDALPSMLASALRHSGKILTPRDATTLTDAIAKFKELKESGDIPRAVKALNRVSKIGLPGKIESYAASASEVNTLANELVATVTDSLTELDKNLDGATGEDGIQIRVTTMMKFLQLQNDYGGLRQVKPKLSVFQKALSKKNNSKLFREAKTVFAAKQAKTKSAKTKAIEKLNALIESTENEAIKSLAVEVLSLLGTAN